MKAKIIRGKSFAGVCRYVEDVGKRASGKQPELICSTLTAQTSLGRIRELSRIAQSRPDVDKPVWHCSLSLPEGERLSAEKWTEVVRDFVSGMGMDADRQPYFAVRHQDTAHDHVHLVLCRVMEDGSLFYGQKEAVKAIKVTQVLEAKHGLKATQGLHRRRKLKVQVKGNEIQMAERKGKAPPKLKLQALIDSALEAQKSASLFVTTLEMAGVDVIPALSPSGKLNGFVFVLDGVAFKGSQLGKDYGLKGLLSRGLSYDKGREYEELNAAGDRARSRANSANENFASYDRGVSFNSSGRDGEGRESLRGNSGNLEAGGSGRFEISRTPEGGSLRSNGHDDGGNGRSGDSSTAAVADESRSLDRGIVSAGGSDRGSSDVRGNDRESSGRSLAEREREASQNRVPVESRGDRDDGRGAEGISSYFTSDGKAEERREVNVKHAHRFSAANQSVQQCDARARATIAFIAAGLDLCNAPGGSRQPVPGHESGRDSNAFSRPSAVEAFFRNLGKVWAKGRTMLEMSCRKLGAERAANFLHLRWSDDARGRDLRRGADRCGKDGLQGEVGDRSSRRGDVYGLSGGLRSVASSAGAESYGGRSAAEEGARSAPEPKRRSRGR